MFTNNFTIEHANFPEISSPIALSEIEPTMSRSDFSGSEFQELMAEFVSTTIVDSRNVAMDHTYHKLMITEEDNISAANQPQRSGDEGSSEILDELRCISPIDSIPDISNEIEVMDDEDSISNVHWNATEHEIWKELKISPNDLFEDPFAAKPPLSQIQGNFLENHKMDYFGKYHHFVVHNLPD